MLPGCRERALQQKGEAVRYDVHGVTQLEWRRRAMRMSAREAAAAAGVSAHQVCRLETGRAPAGYCVKELQALAALFGVEPDTLLKEVQLSDE